MSLASLLLGVKHTDQIFRGSQNFRSTGLCQVSYSTSWSSCVQGLGPWTHEHCNSSLSSINPNKQHSGLVVKMSAFQHYGPHLFEAQLSHLRGVCVGSSGFFLQSRHASRLTATVFLSKWPWYSVVFIRTYDCLAIFQKTWMTTKTFPSLMASVWTEPPTINQLLTPPTS